MAFKYPISFATSLAANFGCNWFRIMPDIFSKLLMPPSEVTVLFDLNLSRHPFLGLVVNLDDVKLDLLLCTGFNLEHVVLFLCPGLIFRGQQMIKRLRDAMKNALVCNKFLPITLKFLFHLKNSVVNVQNLHTIINFLTLQLSQYCKSGSMFSLREPSATSSDCSPGLLRNTLCWYSPIQLAQAVP